VAQLIRLGRSYINLDLVTEIHPLTHEDGFAVLRVYFGAEWTNVSGAKLAALESFLNRRAIDVVAWYGDMQSQEADWDRAVEQESARADQAMESVIEDQMADCEARGL